MVLRLPYDPKLVKFLPQGGRDLPRQAGRSGTRATRGSAARRSTASGSPAGLSSPENERRSGQTEGSRSGQIEGSRSGKTEGSHSGQTWGPVRLLLVPPRDLHHLKTRGVLVKPRVAVLVKPRAAVLVKYGAPCDCFWFSRGTFITCAARVLGLDTGLCREGGFSLSFFPSESLSLSHD